MRPRVVIAIAANSASVCAGAKIDRVTPRERRDAAELSSQEPQLFANPGSKSVPWRIDPAVLRNRGVKDERPRESQTEERSDHGK